MKEVVVKKYPWYKATEAVKDSGKSLAELFDFKTGMLVWKDEVTD